jgi:Na+/proline symporter
MAIVLYAPALALSQSNIFAMHECVPDIAKKRQKIVPCLATGLNIWLSVVSIGVVCTFYSSVVRSRYDRNEDNELEAWCACSILFVLFQGGMKAVIWTDVLQAMVILAGLLAAIIQG